MATKAQQLKKELTQAFPELKFSVKTNKGVIDKISVDVKGLIGSPYTMSEIKLVTNKYHSYVSDSLDGGYTGDTIVSVSNNDLDAMFDEIKVMLNIENEKYDPYIYADLYKVANNEFFSVLPDGYYEEKIAEIEQVDEPNEYKIESIVFNSSVFNSADQFIKHIQSWYKNDPKNLPSNGLYDKVDFTIYFGNGKENRDYTMRLYVSQTDDNPFVSENLLYNHFLAFCEEFKSHPSKDFYAELEFFSKCDWGQSKIVDLKSQYHEYLQDKLSRKEYDAIITLEAFKDKVASMPVKFIFP
jgi:hypothetical protein